EQLNLTTRSQGEPHDRLPQVSRRALEDEAILRTEHPRSFVFRSVLCRGDIGEIRTHSLSIPARPTDLQHQSQPEMFNPPRQPADSDRIRPGPRAVGMPD